MSQIKSVKIIYNFNRYARSVFKAPDRDSKNPRQFTLSSEYNIVYPGTVLAKIVIEKYEKKDISEEKEEFDDKKTDELKSESNMDKQKSDTNKDLNPGDVKNLNLDNSQNLNLGDSKDLDLGDTQDLLLDESMELNLEEDLDSDLMQAQELLNNQDIKAKDLNLNKNVDIDSDEANDLDINNNIDQDEAEKKTDVNADLKEDMENEAKAQDISQYIDIERDLDAGLKQAQELIEDQEADESSKVEDGKNAENAENAPLENIITDKYCIEDFTGRPENYESQHVHYKSKEKEFISSQYGFVAIVGDCMEILPLTSYTNDRLKAYIHIYSNSEGQFPEYEQIKRIIDEETIVNSIEEQIICTEIDAIRSDPERLGDKILIAEGVPPINGTKEHFKLLKNIDKKIGKILDDGRMDYKEKDFFVITKKDEPIAEFVAEIPNEDGVDVFGKKTVGKLLTQKSYRTGKNLVPKEEGSHIYVSAIDGIMDITKDSTINIEDCIRINQNVNLETGNIYFNGFVIINGTVEPGFRVVSEKGIMIKDNVEDAFIKANGKIAVQNGIIGSKTRVISKDNIVTRFIQNSQVFAEKDIIVSESIVQGKCFAKEFIKVGSNILGGEVLGRHGIEVAVAGNISETKTALITGKDPGIDKKIDVINKELSQLNHKRLELFKKMSLQIGNFNFNDIKALLPTLTTPKKKKLLIFLQEIKEYNRTIQELKSEKEKLIKSIEFKYPPTITIKEEVFPGVTIMIRTSKKEIEEQVSSNITYKEDLHNNIVIS